MSNMKIRRTAIAVAAATLLPFSLAACSDSGKDGASGSGSDKSSEASAPAAPATPDASMAMDKPFGPACAGVPAEGAGSFDGMAKDPVATAASNNPALSTLVAAVKQAGLVDTLNNAKDITVFA
ncbi:fasciclin domain-containing protein, partial [Streptomyces sp. SID7760]|nr:fasciclin domain-containing protein [Streptomyces sp. SID7760]